MGTSTCDMLVAPVEEVGDTLVRGICGQVPGSVIPGMLGLEAGQSAFGDVYAWFKNILLWPLKHLDNSPESEKILSEIEQSIIVSLSEAAEKIPVNEDDELSIDWLNGRRTPDANQSLQGAITGLNLGTDAPGIFKSLVEATCFGAKAIVDRFKEQGVPVKGLIGLGGVAQKSSYIMQTMSNVMEMPIKVHKSEQTCAAGAAMFAATAAGIFTKVEEAMEAMGQGFAKEYFPEKEQTAIYQRRYKRYLELGKCIEHNFKG